MFLYYYIYETSTTTSTEFLSFAATNGSIEQYLLLKYTVTENGTEKKLTMCAQRATCPWTDRRDESGTFGIHSSPPRHQIPVKELCLSLWQTEGILLGPPDQKNARLSKTIGSATEYRRNLLSKVLLRELEIPSVLATNSEVKQWT